MEGRRGKCPPGRDWGEGAEFVARMGKEGGNGRAIHGRLLSPVPGKKAGMLTFCALGARVAMLGSPRPRLAARSNPAPARGLVSTGRVRRRDKAPPRARPPPISASAIMGQMIHFNLAISPEGAGTGCGAGLAQEW